MLRGIWFNRGGCGGIKGFLIDMLDTHRAVDVLGDGLIWRLVLTADCQPNVTFITLYQPAVTFHHTRQAEEQQRRKQEGQKQGGQTDSAGHGSD